MNSLTGLFLAAVVGVIGSIVFSRIPYFLIRRGHSAYEVVRLATIAQGVFMAMAVVPAFLIIAGLFGFLGVAGLAILSLIFLLQYLLPPYVFASRLHRIDENDPQLGWVTRLAREVARKASYSKRFEVYLDPSPIPNAYAVSNEVKRMVAVTAGLLNLGLTREEIEAVLAHEIGHLAHRDNSYTVSTSLVPLLLYIFGVGMLLTGYYMAVAASSVPAYNERQRAAAGYAALIGLALAAIGAIITIFSVFVNIPILAFSRTREHLADIHAVNTLRNDSLVSALRKIEASISMLRTSTSLSDRIRPGVRKMLYIVPALSSGFIETLFSTHPTMEERELVIRARLAELQSLPTI